jgi:hypothetical protein
MAGGQGFGKVVVLHGRDGVSVSERPGFVGALSTAINSFREGLVGRMQDGHGPWVRDPLRECQKPIASTRATGACVAQLNEFELSGDCLPAKLLR